MVFPKLEKYGMDPYVSNTCEGWSGPRGVMYNGIKEFDGNGADSSIVGNRIGTTMVDDLGVCCNYGQVGALISCFSNRDSQNHSHMNVVGNKPPIRSRRRRPPLKRSVWPT